MGTIRFPGITVAAGFLLLAFLVWWGGPLIGIQRTETRLILILSLFLVWTLFLLVDRYRAERGGKLLEQSLRQQAEAQAISSRPDRREGIESLRIEFEKAIASLKESKIGKKYRGSAALYALPWYLLIGPPASGKSTALLHSGLQFPYIGGSGKGTVKGIGGTRNCDWWFTNSAIFLDTAGRYVTQDEDREEWFGFLDLLKRYRRETPMNGALVMISITDLLQGTEGEVEEHARNIRSRIDELIERLKINFPVYLVFTKCDLIRGFVDFFEDFNRSDREMVWGATFPKDRPEGLTARQVFDAELGHLLRILRARRMARLSFARGARKVHDIFGFPLQLASGREKLVRFVELLFEANSFHENPVFRGFYLCSGTQEGTPIDRLLGSVGGALGLRTVQNEPFETPPEPKGYFIKRLFTDTIIPDQRLAGPSSRMMRRNEILRVGVFLGSVLFMILVVAGLGFSYIGNKVFIRSVRSASLLAVQIDDKNDQQFEQNLALLERIRGELGRLRQNSEEGVPLRLRGGLYQGARLYPPMRDLYFARFNEMILAPTTKEVEAELIRVAGTPRVGSQTADYDGEYLLLKTYLILSGDSTFDPLFLEKSLQGLWEQRLISRYAGGSPPKELLETVSTQIHFYVQNFGREGFLGIQADPKLIEPIRRRLLEIPLSQRRYNRIRREAMEKGEVYTLETALRGRGTDIFKGAYSIPALFTEEKWKTAFHEALDQSVKEESLRDEASVLGLSGLKREALKDEVEKLYLEEYGRQWLYFLEGIQIRSGESLPEIEQVLSTLSQPDSPLAALLSEVDRNTNLSKPKQDPVSLAQGVIDRMTKGLGIGRPDAAGSTEILTSVGSRFRSIHEFISPADPKKESGLVRYTAEVRRVHEAVQTIVQSGGGPEGAARAAAQAISSGAGSEFLKAQRAVDNLLKELDAGPRKVTSPFLLQPFKGVFANLTRGASLDLNRRWKNEIYGRCQQGIAARYPFNREGEDASFDDLAEFLHPQNGILWKFYEKEMKPFVDEAPHRWEVKKTAVGLSLSPEFLDALRHARLVSESLFPRGNPELKFSFALYPYPGGREVSEILLVVDGKELRYRNEPPDWYKFTWPGPSNSPGASLQINAGGPRPPHKEGGRWGFLKLLEAGRLISESNTDYMVAWQIEIPDTAKGGKKRVDVRYRVQADSSKNLLTPGLFSKFRCPANIG